MVHVLRARVLGPIKALKRVVCVNHRVPIWSDNLRQFITLPLAEFGKHVCAIVLGLILDRVAKIIELQGLVGSFIRGSVCDFASVVDFTIARELRAVNHVAIKGRRNYFKHFHFKKGVAISINVTGLHTSSHGGWVATEGRQEIDFNVFLKEVIEDPLRVFKLVQQLLVLARFIGWGPVNFKVVEVVVVVSRVVLVGLGESVVPEHTQDVLAQLVALFTSEILAGGANLLGKDSASDFITFGPHRESDRIETCL